MWEQQHNNSNNNNNNDTSTDAYLLQVGTGGLHTYTTIITISAHLTLQCLYSI